MKTTDTETIKAALFPIPNSVVFPGSTVPLHVFEPRYRAMIHHCLEDSMLLAIAHTIKTKGSVKTNKNLEVALNQNQTSYEPHTVFSAGKCQLIETTEDGRMHVEVNILKRLQLVEIEQEIPFQTVKCIELFDQNEPEMVQKTEDSKQDVYALMLAISKTQSPELHTIINQPAWKNLSPADFSFKIFEYFRFEADFMQHVLEQTSVQHRLELIWQGINQVLEQH